MAEAPNPKTTLVVKAPNSSGAHKALHEVAGESTKLAQSAKETLRNFLWLTNAHYDLVAFVQVCENVLEILQIRNWGAFIEECQFEELPKVLTWVLSNRKSIKNKILKYDEQAAETFDRPLKPLGKNPLQRKGVSRHELYAALAVRHQSKTRQMHFSFVQGCLFFGHARKLLPMNSLAAYEAYGGVKEWNAIGNRMKAPAEAVRAFAFEKHSMWLERLPLAGDPYELTKQMADTVKQELIDNIKSRQRELYESLWIFFDKVYGSRDTVTRRRTTGGPRTSGINPSLSDLGWTSHRVDRLDNPIGDPEDPDFDWGNQTLVTAPSATPSETNEILDADDDPGEDDSDHYAVLTEIPGVNAGNVAEHTAAAEAQANHIEMANQFLPWSYFRLADSEISALLISSSEWVHAKLRSDSLQPKFNDEEVVRLKTLILLHTVVWTGCEPEPAATIVYARDEESARKRLSSTREEECSLCFVPAQSREDLGHWYRRALVPVYARERDRVEGECKRDPFISLPDVANTGVYVRLLMQEQGLRISPDEPVRIFDLPEFQSPADKLKHLLKEMPKTGDWTIDPTGRITVGKLSRFLFRLLMQSTGGDIATASLITGYAHPVGHARLFYATPSLKSLQQTYAESVRGVAERIKRASSKRRQSDNRPLLFAPEDQYIGSRQNPTLATVQKALVQCKHWLTKGQPTTMKDRLQYHARFTAYTVLCHNFATAIRGIINPVPRLTEIERRIGIVLVNDKGVSKARPALIPDHVISQLEFYAEHTRRLSRYIPKLPKMLNDYDLTGRCFFLDKQRRPIPVRPSTLEIHMKEIFFPFAANVQRRFLRNLMVEKCWPIEVIDAFLGHWAAGEQWFADFSSFSPRNYFRFLESHLFPLLLDLGFEAVESTLR